MARGDKEAARQAALAKAAAAGNKKSAAPKQPKKRWYKQIAETYTLTSKNDPKLALVLAGVAGAGLLVTVLLSVFTGLWWFFAPLGVLSTVALTLFVFGRRAEASAYAQVEGQPGAAAAVLQTLRAGWFTTAAVAVTKNQDVIHRVVGKPGIILVAEGPATRTTSLMAAEVKRTRRFVAEVPIHEVFVGDGEGQVGLRKLNKHVTKLPRVLRPAEVSDVRKRLDALAATQPMLPIPKGPVPKGARIPKGMPR